MKKLLLNIILLTTAFSLFATDELKNVLIIGDSISMGYTPSVKELLKDKANVQRVNGNARNTDNGIKKMELYLGDTKWSVIHFNFGLHDLCYRSAKSKLVGNRDKIKGVQDVAIEQYEINLQKIVDLLKSTNAKLIFATTTYIPPKEAGRFEGDEIKYNEIAIKVMQKNGIKINHLYELSKDIFPKYGMGIGNVHYKSSGSKILGEKVSKSILEELNSNQD